MLYKQDGKIIETSSRITRLKTPKGLHRIQLGMMGGSNIVQFAFSSFRFFMFASLYKDIFEEFQIFKETGESRTILLYGDTGTGKSIAAKQLIVDNPDMFTIAMDSDFLDAYLEQEYILEHNDRRILLVDEFDRSKYSLTSWLKFLDGSNYLSENLFTIITTNNIKKFPRELIDRPGRIDSIYEIQNPAVEEKLEFLKFNLGEFTTTPEVVNAIDNCKLAYLNEVINLCKRRKLSLPSAINKIADRQALIKKVFA